MEANVCMRSAWQPIDLSVLEALDLFGLDALREVCANEERLRFVALRNETSGEIANLRVVRDQEE